MTDYSKLWCVIDEDSFKNTKGNIPAHVWHKEEEAYTQADQFASAGSSAVVFKLEAVLISKKSGVIREKIVKKEAIKIPIITNQNVLDAIRKPKPKLGKLNSKPKRK